LRELLKDKSPTRIVDSLEEGRLYRHTPAFLNAWGPPAVLTDARNRKQRTIVRRCDVAAETLVLLVPGLPEFHPLLDDADERVAEMSLTLSRYRGRYRQLSLAERTLLGRSDCDHYTVQFIADLPPLGRPATAEDVKLGKAVFHLGGKGKLVDLKLPALGTWKKGGKPGTPSGGIIVQAEMRPNGEVVYGVIERHAIRMAPALEFVAVTPLPRARE
jgi:hypothetical protein